MSDHTDHTISQDHKAKLHRIGEGFCGTVWAATSDDKEISAAWVFKREDGGPSRSLHNDYRMHRRILNCMKTLAEIKKSKNQTHQQALVPACFRFIPPTEEPWWKRHLSRFPDGHSPCNTLQAQRIPSFGSVTRRLLVERYCPPDLRPEILSSDTNRSCLIRPYLGRRGIQRTSEPGRSQAFSLRNFPLHIDQMMELGIPIGHRVLYARAMAEALATIHWLGQMDGNDIEFVLAPPPADGTHEGDTWVNILGPHALWILDFDLVRIITMNEHGVLQAVTAFQRNDPFYPRPGRGSILWEVFRKQYLSTSHDCITTVMDGSGQRERLALSQRFIEILEVEGP